MTRKRFACNLLGILCMVALLTSVTWVKAADAADLTHHDITVKDEKGKPLAGASCVVSAPDGRTLSTGVTSKKGLFSFYGYTGATVTCYGNVEVYKGKVKAGPKHIKTKKESLGCRLVCSIVPDVCYCK
ncbi:MAG: carboxypeptidase-like regulatory domain-containing protein [bacterium]|nr:carboxypeptidase-like regulatory domain-containing protein [bacterium]